MLGLGPMNVASMAPENRASVAAPPALNVLVFRLTSGPSLSAKIPVSMPAIAEACVTLGKYPSRRVTGSAFLAVVVVVGDGFGLGVATGLGAAGLAVVALVAGAAAGAADSTGTLVLSDVCAAAGALGVLTAPPALTSELPS